MRQPERSQSSPRGTGPLRLTGKTALRGQAGGEPTWTKNGGVEALALVVLSPSLQAAIGDLEHVRRIVKMLASVNCAPGSMRPRQVVNGASELLLHVFWETVVFMARAAIGTSVLPGGIPVEIELVVECERWR